MEEEYKDEYNEEYKLFLEKTTDKILRSGLPLNGEWVKISKEDAYKIVEHIGNLFLFFTNRIEYAISHPIREFMFVEDGSIKQEDVDEIQRRRPDVKVITYRQGSAIPVLSKK